MIRTGSQESENSLPGRQSGAIIWVNQAINQLRKQGDMLEDPPHTQQQLLNLFPQLFFSPWSQKEGRYINKLSEYLHHQFNLSSSVAKKFPWRQISIVYQHLSRRISGAEWCVAIINWHTTHSAQKQDRITELTPCESTKARPGDSTPPNSIWVKFYLAFISTQQLTNANASTNANQATVER